RWRRRPQIQDRIQDRILDQIQDQILDLIQAAQRCAFARSPIAVDSSLAFAWSRAVDPAVVIRAASSVNAVLRWAPERRSAPSSAVRADAMVSEPRPFDRAS